MWIYFNKILKIIRGKKFDIFYEETQIFFQNLSDQKSKKNKKREKLASGHFLSEKLDIFVGEKK